MSTKGRPIPGQDADGFISFQDLRGAATRMPVEQFCAVYSQPSVLLQALLGDEHGSPAVPGAPLADQERSYKRTVSGGGETSTGFRADPASLVRYHERVGFFTKRPGNPFPNMVSVGRAMNNDLTIQLESISKLHGYFLREGNGWFFVDHRSTNGTLVNDMRLEPEEKRALADGDRVRLGPDLILHVMLSPASLFRRACGPKM